VRRTRVKPFSSSQSKSGPFRDASDVYSTAVPYNWQAARAYGFCAVVVVAFSINDFCVLL